MIVGSTMLGEDRHERGGRTVNDGFPHYLDLRSFLGSGSEGDKVL